MMDEKTVDRIAKAIYDADSPPKLLDWERRDAVIQEPFRNRARAAIEAYKAVLAENGIVGIRYDPFEC